MWIARNKNKCLYIYENKPIKVKDQWISYHGYVGMIPINLYQEVKWEDKEPKLLIVK